MIYSNIIIYNNIAQKFEALHSFLDKNSLEINIIILFKISTFIFERIEIKFIEYKLSYI